MAILLNPFPEELGVAAPWLGPWFKKATFGQFVNLPALDSDGRLAVTIDLGNDGTRWMPPAAGTLSLFIADAFKPQLPIAHLQDGKGDWPFDTGAFVALFRLLPEVEERLHELSRLIPPATAPGLPEAPVSPFPVNHRARIRSFALVPNLAQVDYETLIGLLGGSTNLGLTPDPGDTPDERKRKEMQAVGLDIAEGSIVNGPFPMTRLRRPGRFEIGSSIAPPGEDDILTALEGEAELWAFDHRGRAVDAGAVAAWWSWLMNSAVGSAGPGDPPQLLAPGINPIDLPQNGGAPVLCVIADGLSAHFANSHEAPLGQPFIGGRLRANGETVESPLMTSDGAALQFDFAPLAAPSAARPPDNPLVDNAPRARVAALPAGPYESTITLWLAGTPSAPGLSRDFVRVGVVDEEQHLVGVARRDSREEPANAEQRRSSDQNRPSTRVFVERTQTGGPVLLPTAEDASLALDAVLSAGGIVRAVLGIADSEAGPVVEPTLFATSGATFPPVLREAPDLAQSATYRVRALAGGGEAAEGDQAVLLEVNLGPEHDGAWLRAWPLGFLLDTGLRPRLTGGAGRVAGGRAQLIMTLPAGRLDARGLLSFDAQLSRVGASGDLVTRLYADCRFERPTPIAGGPATAITGNWAICETGETGSGTLPVGSVPPGASVVLFGNPPAIVDRTRISAIARSSETMMNRLPPGARLSLTSPAFGATADRLDTLGRPLARAVDGGDRTGGLASLANVRTHLLERGAESSGASSAPLALQDRLEVAAAAVAPPSAAVAMLTGGPRLPLFHETLPHHLGHPGVRAAIETHATGVFLDGRPALAVAEFVRERTAGLAFDPVNEASEPARSIAIQSELAVAAESVPAFPPVPEAIGPGPVAAVLRTGPIGQEGIPGLALGASALSAFPLSEHEDALEDFLNGTTLPGSAGPLGTFLRSHIGDQIDSLTRSLDRRLLIGQRGAREAAVAIAAAFDRAQDFIYLETPAIDLREHGPQDDRLNPVNQLLDRLSARPGLRLIICAPARLGPGTPKMLQAIRDSELLAAVQALRAAGDGRVAFFAPGAGAGRALRLATTTVIVDDVFAVTGTTHLWRRGLTFDSSLAAAVFDERLVEGRPFEIVAFRRRLIADRLGLPPSRLPDDPIELVQAISQLDETTPNPDFGTQPSHRRSAYSILAPDPTPTELDVDTWNPDGSRDDLDLSVLLGAVALTDPEHAVLDD